MKGSLDAQGLGLHIYLECIAIKVIHSSDEVFLDILKAFIKSFHVSSFHSQSRLNIDSVIVLVKCKNNTRVIGSDTDI